MENFFNFGEEILICSCVACARESRVGGGGIVLKVIRGDLFSDFLGTNNNTVGVVVSMIPQSLKKKSFLPSPCAFSIDGLSSCSDIVRGEKSLL